MDRPMAERACTPCRGDVAPLRGAELDRMMGLLGEGWELHDGRRIERTFLFANFREALDFVNAVGEIAERENHHPDLALAWGRATVSLHTHKIGGLSENDFILAAKIDALRG